MREEKELNGPAQPTNSFLSFIQQLIPLISLIPSIIFMNFRNKLVGLYCYNIFLFPSAKQASLNERKIKLFVFLEWKWRLCAALLAFIHSSIKEIDSFIAAVPLGGRPLHSINTTSTAPFHFQWNCRSPAGLVDSIHFLFLLPSLNLIEFVWWRSLFLAERCGCSRP